MSIYYNQYQTKQICEFCNQSSFPTYIKYNKLIPEIIYQCENSHEKILSFNSFILQPKNIINKKNNNELLLNSITNSQKNNLETILKNSEKNIVQISNIINQIESNLKFQIDKVKQNFYKFKQINQFEIDFCRSLINNESVDNIKNFLIFNEQKEIINNIQKIFFKINELNNEFSLFFKDKNNLLLKEPEIKIEKKTLQIPKSIKYYPQKEINFNTDIETLLLLKNNKMIVSCGDGNLRIFKNYKMKQIINETQPNGNLTRIRYIIELKNGNIAYSLSNGNIKIGKFDQKENLNIIAILKDENKDIVKIIENKDEKLISCSNHIIFWNRNKLLNDYQSETKIKLYNAKIDSILELPENKLAISSKLCPLYIIDMNTFFIYSIIKSNCNDFSDTLCLIDQNYLAVADYDKINLINLTNYKIEMILDFAQKEIGTIKYYFGNLFVGFQNLVTLMGKVEVFQVENNLVKILHSPNIHDDMIVSINFNEKNEMLTGSFDKTIQICKIEF
jgi:hypothetical protein